MLLPDQQNNPNVSFFQPRKCYLVFFIFGIIFILLLVFIRIFTVKNPVKKLIPTFVLPTQTPPLPTTESQIVQANQDFPQEITLGKYNQITVNNKLLYGSQQAIVSPNKKNIFFYKFIDPTVGTLCDYAIYNKNGTSFRLLEKGVEQIPCSSETGIHNNAFLKWTDDNSFLMEATMGAIKLYDISTLNTPRVLYEYDIQRSRFIGVNNDYTRWLMRRSTIEQNKVSLYVNDKVNSPLSQNYILNSSESSRLIFEGLIPYDVVNNGFILVTRNYEGNNTWGEFYFLDTRSYQLRKVRIGKQAIAPSRGCGGFVYEVKNAIPGEIFITVPDCLTVNKDDLEPDRTIKLTL